MPWNHRFSSNKKKTQMRDTQVYRKAKSDLFNVLRHKIFFFVVVVDLDWNQFSVNYSFFIILILKVVFFAPLVSNFWVIHKTLVEMKWDVQSYTTNIYKCRNAKHDIFTFRLLQQMDLVEMELLAMHQTLFSISIF